MPAAASSSPAESAPIQAASPPDAWEDFWRAREVVPAPPVDFLAAPELSFRVDNLTDGLLTDAEAHGVAVATVRRGAGDGWAARHFRYDIVNSNVLGPPGLNGTINYMRQSQSAGVVAIECPQSIIDTVAVGVIALPPDLVIQNPRLGFTRIVVVLLRRATGASCVRIYADGRREPIPYKPKGELSWQLDTGELQALPEVGSVWYQARGWTCHPDDPTVIGNLCAMVRP